MGVLWTLFEPFLFGLIGADVSFADMDSSTIGKDRNLLLVVSQNFFQYKHFAVLEVEKYHNIKPL